MSNFDLIVIGGGPGGYVAAIKGAQLGLNTAIIEKDRFGGTCLNRGCIPTKAMLHAADLYREILEGGRFGIHAEKVTVNYGEVLDYKQETIDKLVSGVEQLLKANGVTMLKGTGTLLADRQVKVTFAEPAEDGATESYYDAEHIILAGGSYPAKLPVEGMELEGVLTSDGLFALKEIPESLTIIGGGVIGVEFAEVFSALGCKVTILEALPKLLANLDKEISQNLKMILKKRGVDIHTGASLAKIEKDPAGGLICHYTEKDKDQAISSQYVLCAVGRKPNAAGLFLDPEEFADIVENSAALTTKHLEAAAQTAHDLGITMERGFIETDIYGQTGAPGIYAIGDIVKGIQLAHVASAQGITAAEKIAGHTPNVDLAIVPSCIYTSPEIASVGITEEDAKASATPVKVGKYITSANGKSLISKEERGFVKIIAHADTGEILGAQMMCARATDMIGEMATAIANKLTPSQLLKGMRAHPTYNEAVGEALEELEGGAIHMAPKKKK